MATIGDALDSEFSRCQLCLLAGSIFVLSMCLTGSLTFSHTPVTVSNDSDLFPRLPSPSPCFASLHLLV